MSNELRTRTARVMLATILFGGAALSALQGSDLGVKPLFARSDPDPNETADLASGWSRIQCCFCYDPPLPSCVDRADDDHCFRELYRAQLEALDANLYFDRLSALRHNGALLAKPTVVRRPLGGTTY